MPVELICEICGKNFTVSPSKAKGRRFCSTRCRDIAQRGSPPPSKEQMYKLYWKEELSLREIAERLGVSSHAVWKWLKRYGIKRRPIHSDVQRKRVGEALRRAYAEGRRKLWWKVQGKPHPFKGRHHTEEAKEKNRQAHLGKKPSENQLRGLREGWKIREARNPQFERNRLKGLLKRPTKPERRIIQIIKRYDLPYQYVGDGKVIIEGLCPDFINNNGGKRVIEVFGDYWHHINPKRYIGTERGRKEVFAKYGFDALILWVSEMDRMSDGDIAQIVRNFEVESS